MPSKSHYFIKALYIQCWIWSVHSVEDVINILQNYLKQI